MNAALRAQAGGPLGLSWGLSVLNLFWKQRKKPESCCGQTRRGFTAKYTHIWSPRHSPGISHHALPTPDSPSSLVQAPPLRASFLKALGTEYFYMGGGGGRPEPTRDLHSGSLLFYTLA